MSIATLPPSILLVDDDPTVRFLLQRIIHRHWPHVRVLEAADGEQGLELVQAHCQATQAPHSLLVILDLKMPVLDGVGFLERFQHLSSHCKQAAAVVISSTSTHLRDFVQAQSLANAWRPKPLGAEHLEPLLRQYLPAALAA